MKRRLTKTLRVARALYIAHRNDGPYDFEADPVGWPEAYFVTLAKAAMREMRRIDLEELAKSARRYQAARHELSISAPGVRR